MRRILQLLSDIAGQTHLLALNAAIEAAGAGPFGDRFGVVAQEVKGLADRSSAASQEVVRIVHEVEDVTRTTVQLAGSGYVKARRIADAAREAGDVIQDMRTTAVQAQMQASAIRDAAQAVQERTSVIVAATSQQRAASADVLDAIGRVGQVAERNMVNSQTIIETATTLEEVARRLNTTLAS